MGIRKKIGWAIENWDLLGIDKILHSFGNDKLEILENNLPLKDWWLDIDLLKEEQMPIVDIFKIVIDKITNNDEYRMLENELISYVNSVEVKDYKKFKEYIERVKDWLVGVLFAEKFIKEVSDNEQKKRLQQELFFAKNEWHFFNFKEWFEYYKEDKELTDCLRLAKESLIKINKKVLPVEYQKYLDSIKDDSDFKEVNLSVISSVVDARNWWKEIRSKFIDWLKRGDGLYKI